ncbi:ParB N-terminal domain-containing protein [Longispora sp. NPDC051575]|uniref:ParB/RepB/Spo0J family partition protein n=1 Tax=Longispora sp. NPDC051575 TaxID=3154943 RepID=UPI00342D1B08
MTDINQATPEQPEQELPPLPADYKWVAIKDLKKNKLNIRPDAEALQEIVDVLVAEGASGMLAPLIVVPTDDGPLILDGEQRYLSAVAAKQTHVQGLIREDLVGKVDQITAMLRTLTRTDPGKLATATAIRNLALEGLSDAEIAKKIGWRKPKVAAAKKVAEMNPKVVADQRSQGLDLLQMAAMDDFAGDKNVTEQLLNEAERGPLHFDRQLKQAQTRKALAEALAARTKELQAAGVKVRAGWIEASMNKTWLPLNKLQHDGKKLDAHAHRTCPGHVINLREAGGQVSETAWCSAFKAHGHRQVVDGAPVGGKMTDKDKAERARVIANNKAMEAANDVRVTWLANLLASDDVKGGENVIAEVMLSQTLGHLRWKGGQRELLATLLRKKKNAELAVPRRGAALTVRFALASALAGLEQGMGRESWRTNDRQGLAAAALLLRFCVANGYDLADVEKIILATVERQEAAEVAAKAKAAAKPVAPKTAKTATAKATPALPAADPIAPQTVPDGPEPKVTVPDSPAELAEAVEREPALTG